MESRQEQKERTRVAILDAALELTEERGFSAISLRQVAREAGVVPTAFYRHFAGMDDLGLTLVDRSMSALRAMIRDARRDPRTYEDVIVASSEILVCEVKKNRAEFAFIARERYGGNAVVRDAISHEMRLFVSDLALDLARFPYVEKWNPDDVQVLSELFVTNMVGIAERVIEMPPGRPELESAIIDRAKRQMRMIVLGFAAWNPSH